MISPASFNYYQECIARALELYLQANKTEITVIREDLIRRSNALMSETPYGFLIND